MHEGPSAAHVVAEVPAAWRAPAARRPLPLRAPGRARAITRMRDHGLRVSSARRVLLEALLVADGPMSAEQIAAGIGGRVPSSDLASVYRNLERLEEIGIVRHVHLGHGPGLYELAVDGEREYLTCERCADFEAVDPRALRLVRALIERDFGYRASFTHFPIVGLCTACVRELEPTDGLAGAAGEPG